MLLFHCRLVGALLGDRLAGVALWQPPGRFPLSFVRKLGMTPGLLRAAIGAGRALTRFANSGAALEQAFPREPVWYLQALGVHPSAQRRGVGAALLRDGLALVDADNARCHLHTSDAANVQYYKRWGFELTQPAFSAGAGGPVLRDDSTGIPLFCSLIHDRSRYDMIRGGDGRGIRCESGAVPPL